jgi:hypothetical protein
MSSCKQVVILVNHIVYKRDEYNQVARLLWPLVAAVILDSNRLV